MRHVVAVLVACSLACGHTVTAGTEDAGDFAPNSADHAAPEGRFDDAGSSAWDGTISADAHIDGAPSDGSRVEAGDASTDGATTLTLCPQVGDPDAGPLDVWRDALGSHTLADRGRIVGCVHQASYTQSQVASNRNFGTQTTPMNGYELYIIQYVSEGFPGVAQAVTGLLYLPNGAPRDVPIVAVGHPTSGMGPSCGPTHTPAITDNVAVPLVGRGYAVVASDYGGMGVDNGMTSYLVGASEAAAMLDGVRALLSFHERRFDASQLSTDFFVVGHSQGGHAALFAHQRFDSAIGVHLLGSVAFAPGLGNAKDWSLSFSNPSQATVSFDVFPTMSLYSHMVSKGGPDAGSWLTPAAQLSLPGIFHDECSTVASSLTVLFPTQGDLFLSAFTSAAAACAFTAPCAGFEPWSTALIAEQPGNFASSAPALLLQGTADTVVTPAQTTCILNRLAAHGTPAQGCAYSGVDHVGIVPAGLPDAIRWMAARRAGQLPAVCATPITGACTLPN